MDLSSFGGNEQGMVVDVDAEYARAELVAAGASGDDTSGIAVEVVAQGYTASVVR